ncbi:UNVERIFIED_CONTAM: RHS repeat-associated core domain-containing protein [Pseudomonas aeruginosa]
MESDPIGLAGGLNTFSYAYGNPVNLIDPNGLAGTTVDAYCLRYGPQACADVTGGSATSGSINATGISLWCLLTKTCSANESSAQNEKNQKTVHLERKISIKPRMTMAGTKTHFME